MADYVGQQLGSYRIIRLLGTGGFAEVYLGEHMRLNTQAAIKVLHTQLTEKEMGEFLNEARTIARLDHPNIVRVYEFDVREGVPFLVMTYAPNGTLRQRHPMGTILPLPTVVSYVKQVADALQYAHDSKLIHRDIKPENMLVGSRNEILLSDFGIAKVARTSRSETDQRIAGTAAYMAPEQIQGHPRFASDQYALGIVVYEWLSGNRPFHGSFFETCSQHLYAYPPALHTKNIAVSPELEQVVLKALEKDPYQRFPSVKAFAEALERASTFSRAVAPVHSVHPPEAQMCPGCGMQVPLNTAYCGSCGYQMTATIGQIQPTAGMPGHTLQAAPVPSKYGEQPAAGPVRGAPGNVAGGTIPATPPLSQFPPQKRAGRKNIQIGGLILLAFLIIAGFVSYPFINTLLHQQPELPCLTSTEHFLFGDCFQDNRNHWDTPTVPNQFSATVGNGSLVLEDDNNTLFAEQIRGNPHAFSDFTLNVDAVLSKGDQNNGYGVYIRSRVDTRGMFKTYYRFELFGDGTYAIYKGIVDTKDTSTVTKLVDFTANAAIHRQGSINHITIVARGSTMTLMVNGTAVKTITDSDYSTGEIAFFVSNLNSAAAGAQATFSKLGIYQA